MNRTEATQILMLSSNATFDDIKYAYRKLSLKLHPDRNKNEKDGRRFKNVLKAYHFLKGQNRLKNYNYKNKSFWDESQENVSPNPKKKYQNNQDNVYKHNLAVDVDRSKCIGCCSCETIAPNVFAVDKATMFNPKSQVHNQHGASEGKIMDAAETCPTKAIQVNEEKSGRKIYPR